MERSNKSPRNILCACAIFRALLARARSTRFFQNDEKGDRARKTDVSAGPWLHRIGKAGPELRRARYKVGRLKSTRSRFFVSFQEGSWIPGLKSPKFSCCQCSHCATVLADTAHWTSLHKPPLRSPVTIGDRVAVKQRSGGRDGEEARVRMGVVKYVGDLNSPYTSEPVFIGVKLDDPGNINVSLPTTCNHRL